MRPSVFAILVVALTTAYFVNPNDAQSLPFSELTSMSSQGVCQGSTLSFECRTNGTSILLYAPPIIDENLAFNFFHNDPIQLCNSIPNIASASLLFDDDDNTTFTATLTVYVPLQRNYTQPTYNFTVFCIASNGQGSDIQSSTTRTVYEDTPVKQPGTASPSMCESCVMDSSSEGCTSMSTVYLTWPSFRNVEQYVVFVNGSNYSTNQNYISLNLPNGTHIATISAINSCGSVTTNISVNVSSLSCRSRLIVLPDPPTDPDCGALCIGLIVIAAICLALIAVTIVICVYAIRVKITYDKLVQTDIDVHEMTDNKA